MMRSRPRSRFGALSLTDLQNPLLSLPHHSDVGQSLDNVWHLISSCFADITGENGLFLNMLDMASHYQVVFLVAVKNPLTVFYGFLLGWCLTLGVPECLRWDLGGEFESSFSELAEQIGCRLLPAASVSPTQNAPCERAEGAWKYRARRLVDHFFDQVERFFDKTVALCSFELVNKHSDRRQWTQPKSMGAWSILASHFSALVSCVTVSISPTTS